MIWNSLPDNERLRLWKSLRKELEIADLNNQLDRLSKFIGTIPFGSRSIDYYDPSSWPTPWEIIFHGSFCPSSISLLAFYTLALTLRHDIKIELLLIDDSSNVYLVPVIEDQFVLNYETNLVSNYSEFIKEITILKKYTRQDIKII